MANQVALNSSLDVLASLFDECNENVETFSTTEDFGLNF